MGALNGDSNNTVPAVYGKNTNSGDGVIGESELAEGVRGVSHNPNHGGVVGVSDQNRYCEFFVPLPLTLKEGTYVQG
jgi:hypothetical protein